MNGFEKSIRPDDSITREEAATMLVKALKIETQEISALDFADENEEWNECDSAADYVFIFCEKIVQMTEKQENIKLLWILHCVIDKKN